MIREIPRVPEGKFLMEKATFTQCQKGRQGLANSVHQDRQKCREKPNFVFRSEGNQITRRCRYGQVRHTVTSHGYGGWPLGGDTVGMKCRT